MPLKLVSMPFCSGVFIDSNIIEAILPRLFHSLPMPLLDCLFLFNDMFFFSSFSHLNDTD